MMRILRRLSQSCALGGFGLLIAGCGAVFGQVNLYVPNQGNAPPSLNEYTINTSSGGLTPVVGQSTSGTDNNPTRVVMTPNGRFLYVTAANDFVDAYSVDSTGFLTPLVPAHYAVAGTPVGIVADPTGRFLFVSSTTGNAVTVFSINATSGALTPVTCALCALPGGSFPQSLAVDPTGAFLYVAMTGTHQIGVGTITQSGASAGSLSAFVAGYTGGGTFDPVDLALTPGGTFLYATDELSSVVAAFTASGATLNLISTYATGSTPLGIAIDPTGKFLFTANNSSNNVSAFTIGGGGALTAVPGSPFTAGTGPTGVSVEPTGKFVYVSNQFSNSVSSYGITLTGASAGALSLVNTVSTGTAPFYLLAHLAPAASTIPAASTWSLAGLGILLAGISGLLYRKAYR